MLYMFSTNQSSMEKSRALFNYVDDLINLRNFRTNFVFVFKYYFFCLFVWMYVLDILIINIVGCTKKHMPKTFDTCFNEFVQSG